DRLGMRKLFAELELPLVDVLVEMEEAGIAVDLPYLQSLGQEFAREVARIEREAYDAVGHDFPINSPKQLGSLLFEELKLPRGRRTATGYSTDAAVLEELRSAHPVVDKMREQRDVAKMLNFGIVYGMSDFGLAWRMGMARDEAQRFIDEYFKRYAQVRRYVIETKAFCMEQGYVETLLGRRRYIADMTSPNSAIRGAAERMAINMPIQGTAADVMKIAMRRVYDRLA